jgi:16S rRNA (adenine(1408)-N(1))-methyltransferase
MEIIRGKKTSFAYDLAEGLQGDASVMLDIGTGDGRFVQAMAEAQPKSFVIGVDACRENLVAISRNAPKNALFVIANAESLPTELNNVANHLTINFPWGSLLEGLLSNEQSLMNGLLRVMKAKARIEVRLNSSALAQASWSLEAGAEMVQAVLLDSGFSMQSPRLMLSEELASVPTSWSKRLAYGRDPRAAYLRGAKR